MQRIIDIKQRRFRWGKKSKKAEEKPPLKLRKTKRGSVKDQQRLQEVSCSDGTQGVQIAETETTIEDGAASRDDEEAQAKVVHCPSPTQCLTISPSRQDAPDSIDGLDTDALNESEEARAQIEQTIRQRNYIRSTGEEVDDYTYGPPRLVLASDGVQPCAALLLTMDFSAAVQEAVRAQRDYIKARRIATRKFEVALYHELDIECEIANHEAQLVPSENVDERDPDHIQRLKEELQLLQLMLEESKSRTRSDQVRLQSQADNLREIQADANAYLEDAFVAARLVEPESDEPDTPIAELDLQTEYQRFRKDFMERDNNEYIPEADDVPLDTSREQFRVPSLSPSQEAIQDLRDAYWTAHDRLRVAQKSFDYRDEERARHFHANFEAIERGEEPDFTSADDFDVFWVQQYQELTHEVVEAESALAQAKQALLDANIDIGDADQESGFADGVSNGYDLCVEAKQVETAPLEMIQDWIDGISEGASPSFNVKPQVDHWDSRAVEMSDSVSCAPEDSAKRRRIDKWRFACGHDS